MWIHGNIKHERTKRDKTKPKQAKNLQKKKKKTKQKNKENHKTPQNPSKCYWKNGQYQGFFFSLESTSMLVWLMLK